jgi:hypothetical protein
VLVLNLVQFVYEETHEMVDPSGLPCFVLGLELFHCFCHLKLGLQLRQKINVILWYLIIFELIVSQEDRRLMELLELLAKLVATEQEVHLLL